MEYAVCPNCGMEQGSWADPADGYVLAGDRYCCRGCAEDADCMCAAGDEALSTPGFLLLDDDAVSEDLFRLGYRDEHRQRDGNRVRRFIQDCE